MDLSLPPRLGAISDKVTRDIEAVFGLIWCRRVYLEERFQVEGLKFVMLGRKGLVFRMDDLAEQAGVAEQCASVTEKLRAA